MTLKIFNGGPKRNFRKNGNALWQFRTATAAPPPLENCTKVDATQLFGRVILIAEAHAIVSTSG